MENLWSTSIEKLMVWRTRSWNKRYDSKITKWTLRIVYDVLIIEAHTKVYETLNLHNKIKGFYKGDVLILIVSNPAEEVRKIKFQIKSNVVECLKKLAQHFPIVSHSSTTNERVFESRYRNIEEVMKNAMEPIGKPGSIDLPTNFNSFVKLCLLDPNMPLLINKTQKIIEELNK